MEWHEFWRASTTHWLYACAVCVVCDCSDWIFHMLPAVEAPVLPEIDWSGANPFGLVLARGIHSHKRIQNGWCVLLELRVEGFGIIYMVLLLVDPCKICVKKSTQSFELDTGWLRQGNFFDLPDQNNVPFSIRFFVHSVCCREVGNIRGLIRWILWNVVQTSAKHPNFSIRHRFYDSFELWGPAVHDHHCGSQCLQFYIMLMRLLALFWLYGDKLNANEGISGIVC